MLETSPLGTLGAGAPLLLLSGGLSGAGSSSSLMPALSWLSYIYGREKTCFRYLLLKL